MGDGDIRLATPILDELGLVDITEDELNTLCIEVIENNPQQVSNLCTTYTKKRI